MTHVPLRPVTVYLICFLAAIGFAFDIYELLMLPLILRPALLEFNPAWMPGTDEFQRWATTLFYVPAIFGGIFGLLGGYLTDWLGRRRVLTASILLYSFAAFGAALSTNPYQLLLMRCLVFVGVCVEFVAAVAWLSELFPPGKTREKVLGWTQALSSIGGLAVAGVSAYLASRGESLWDLPVQWLPSFWGTPQDPNAAWRYTLASGVVPALPLILIRPFLPESPVWQAAKEAGTLQRPSFGELFAPGLRKTTILCTLMMAASYGVAFGAFQQMPQIIPSFSHVKETVTAQTEKIPDEKKKVGAKRRLEFEQASKYSSWQETGGLVGRCVLALAAVWIVSRRGLLAIFAMFGLILAPAVMYCASKDINPTLFSIGETPIRLLQVLLFAAAACIVGQFSFWGNYLPRVFPLRLRGTGESFAANIGGRLIGTSFAALNLFVLSRLSWPGFGKGPASIAISGCAIAASLMLLMLLLLPMLPEPQADRDAD
jgi:MFS family permease